jgi:hypothetical protein
MAKGEQKKAIENPRSRKKRRSRQLLQRQAKRPQDGSRASVPAKRNSDAAATVGT